MIEWLKDILVIDSIYWYIAIPFTILLVVQFIGTFVGIGGGGEDFSDEAIELGDNSDNEFGFRIFTVRNLITFFTVFGWAGITFSHSSLGHLATVVLSTLLGIIVLLIVSSLFYFTTKLSSSGTMDIKKTIGINGEVYIPIPSSRSGIGKVSIRLQGSLRELDAITDDIEKIPRGAVITVKEVIRGSILLVERSGGEL